MARRERFATVLATLSTEQLAASHVAEALALLATAAERMDTPTAGVATAR